MPWPQPCSRLAGPSEAWQYWAHYLHLDPLSLLPLFEPDEVAVVEEK